MQSYRRDITYGSTKTYTHSVGLSACFRQWRAESHCHLPHGYALSFKFTWEAKTLDKRNWVVDFGAMKSLKGWLEDTFDHKLLIAEDDPLREDIITLWKKFPNGEDAIREVPATGCEAFARMVYEYAEQWLEDNGYRDRCILAEVECREHEGNSAYVRKSYSMHPDLTNSIKGFR